ncbi:MAG TPA: cellulose synthase operon protein YhjQ/BcsQ [Edaphobacter sp.]|nr:cellulose synthase operon protein YhjQ/BcsQ [Edaphobacter sp.]
MDSRSTEKTDEPIVAETPEDVAVLYSWANLHGAKYRDFSASRREYRAQLRHRAAEQVREQALLAQAEAETAAAAAESAARHAAQAARTHQAEDADSSMRRALREAEEAARTAAAERVEAARRAEAAAVAEAAARREEREIAEAHASAQRQAARYADSEIRRRTLVEPQPPSPQTPNHIPDHIPGQITDPYTIYSTPQTPVHSQPSLQPATEPEAQKQTAPPDGLGSNSDRERRESPGLVSTPAPAPSARHSSGGRHTSRRPQGYHPDDASGVRQIYRGPDSEAMQAEYTSTSSPQQSAPIERRALSLSAASQETKPAAEQPNLSPRPSSSPTTTESQASLMGQRHTDPQPHAARPPQTDSPPASTTSTGGQWPPSSGERSGDRPQPADPSHDSHREVSGILPPTKPQTTRPIGSSRITPPSPRPVSPFSQALVPSDSTRGRRAQDDFDYQQSQGFPERRTTSEPASDSTLSQRPSDPAGPAWLYAPSGPQITPKPLPSPSSPVQSSVADTLQHSRERVAARWFALKGVFEQPGQEGQDQPEAAPIRQKETRTPILAVFSLAGGVGKTSLVATVGRALSSMGEKVLLTDTTSHGLLPFYFGASELRQGTVRTFSPPSGSTDAPIYLVSYDVDQKANDAAAQEQLAEEIINNSRGTHRILLDLTVSSSWIVRRLSRMNPTILVPVAPDMNSVISLQTVEKFFSGANDGDGRPLQPFYVLNQFDTSLPLHLDVREVMRRQLGERLLPFVIRRAPAVSEALAEGMTVVDYAPDAPVAEDYLNLATWLRTVAAPATAGFRNVRWSER